MERAKATSSNGNARPRLRQAHYDTALELNVTELTVSKLSKPRMRCAALRRAARPEGVFL